MSERRRMMFNKSQRVWVQLTKTFRGDIPIYAIATVGFTQSSNNARIGFTSKPYNGVTDGMTTPGSDGTNPDGYHMRIYIGGSREGNLSFYYFNPSYNGSGWKTYSQASFEQKNITLANGNVLNNVWVYENTNINKISSYDVEGHQNNAAVVYFNYYQPSATVANMYVLVDK